MDDVTRQVSARRCEGDPDLERQAAGQQWATGRAAGRNNGLPTQHLASAIELHVVPRLVLAHRANQDKRLKCPGNERQPNAEVEEFARVIVSQDMSRALAFIEARRSRGLSLEAIYLNLLAPAARYLGQLWNEDWCDFTAVTLGLGRLHQIVRELSPAFQNEAKHENHGRQVLLAAAPGEQHTFGLSMVAEFFRRAGWDVTCMSSARCDDLTQLLRDEWFAIVGLSVGCEVKLEGLATKIHALRRASRNRALGIMVGGQVFVQRPELVGLVGADATAVDGGQACLQAECMLAMAAHRV